METLKTQRLELRPLSLDHAPALLPIWSDEEVIKYTYVRDITNLERCQKRISLILENSIENDYPAPYSIFLNGELIGIVGSSVMSHHERGLYYQLKKSHWRQGYATEAAAAVLEAAFSDPAVMRVTADTVAENLASAKVLNKLRLKFEGCNRMKFFRNGVYHDMLVYSILRSEYQD